MIRLILTAALVGGLLQHVFGDMPARRKSAAKRAKPKTQRAARAKRTRTATVSR